MNDKTNYFARLNEIKMINANFGPVPRVDGAANGANCLLPTNVLCAKQF